MYVLLFDCLCFAAADSRDAPSNTDRRSYRLSRYHEQWQHIVVRRATSSLLMLSHTLKFSCGLAVNVLPSSFHTPLRAYCMCFCFVLPFSKPPATRPTPRATAARRPSTSDTTQSSCSHTLDSFLLLSGLCVVTVLVWDKLPLCPHSSLFTCFCLMISFSQPPAVRPVQRATAARRPSTSDTTHRSTACRTTWCKACGASSTSCDSRCAVVGSDWALFLILGRGRGVF